jgi:hypothetical protein
MSGKLSCSDILRLLRNEVETADFGNQIVVRHPLSLRPPRMG